MKLQRFIGDYDFSRSPIVIVDEEAIRQIRNVLRLKAGEQVLLLDGKGGEALATITQNAKEGVEVSLEKVMENASESKNNVVLYCAILKRENFELAVQKATEIGVKEIVPLITKRTVKLDIKHERLEKIIKEAAEQSGRGMLPTLHTPMEFDEALRSATSQGKLNLFFDSSGAVLEPKSYNLEAIGLWIGPEGGWDKAELEKVESVKFQVVNLGKLTLRAETAAIVASYLATR